MGKAPFETRTENRTLLQNHHEQPRRPPSPVAIGPTLPRCCPHDRKLLSAYSRAGRPDEVLRLFRCVPFPPHRAPSSPPSYPPSPPPVAPSPRAPPSPPSSSPATALVKSHNASLDSLYHVFVAMAASGCSPDAAAYNCLVSILCDAQRVEASWGVLEDMLENGLRPTVRSYTAIVRGTVSRAGSSKQSG